jgi:hypothetical protein
MDIDASATSQTGAIHLSWHVLVVFKILMVMGAMSIFTYMGSFIIGFFLPPGNEDKLLSPSMVNAPGLLDRLFCMGGDCP